MIVGLYGVSLCLLMPSVLCIGGFGELGDNTANTDRASAAKGQRRSDSITGQGHKYVLELEIIYSNQFSRENQIPVEFNLSGHLQSWCQQCMPVGNKTGANRATFLLTALVTGQAVRVAFPNVPTYLLLT